VIDPTDLDTRYHKQGEDVDLAAKSLLTTDLAIYQLTSSYLAVTNLAKSAYKGIRVSNFIADGTSSARVLRAYDGGHLIVQPPSKATTYGLYLYSGDGVNYVENVLCKGGNVIMANLPAADPADGLDKLWMDANRFIKLGS